MGVNGLLRALQEIQKPTHVSEFKGQRVAIDAFSWLHRGAFTAVKEVVYDLPTDKPIRFCMKRIDMLIECGITPVMVFDGKQLPSKSRTNDKRRQIRAAAKEEAENLLAMGKVSESSKVLGKAVSITERLVKALICGCKSKGVCSIISPYEADAQLGYLSSIGYVAAVVSEDSDLLLYGSKVVLFKLNNNGDCLAIHAADLPNSRLLAGLNYSEESFIILSCLSGCDYIDSIKGVGIEKGAKLIKASDRQGDLTPKIKKVIKGLHAAGYDVDCTYGEQLRRAVWTYRHQPVYEPTTGTITRRIPIPKDTSVEGEALKELLLAVGSTSIPDCEPTGPIIANDELSGAVKGAQQAMAVVPPICAQFDTTATDKENIRKNKRRQLNRSKVVDRSVKRQRLCGDNSHAAEHQANSPDKQSNILELLKSFRHNIKNMS